MSCKLLIYNVGVLHEAGVFASDGDYKRTP